MNEISRRRMVKELVLLGGICGTGWATGEEAKTASPSPDQTPSVPWKYVPLDEGLTATRAYKLHAQKHCMYAVFASVLAQLGEKFGPPYSTFPFDMMVYGKGGIAGWGSVCGALNGAAAAISLLGKNEGEVGKMIQELFRWYEQTALPTYVPEGKPLLDPFPKTVADSVQCHASIMKWCKATGYRHASRERVERCMRISGSVAQKTVELLNATQTGAAIRRDEASAATKQCQECHTPNSEKASVGSQANCASCHVFPSPHPEK